MAVNVTYNCKLYFLSYPSRTFFIMSTIYRPIYHFSPPQGWINDPNGLVYYKGLWHLFYQHQPDQLQHGPMHWGHAISRDLATWEHRPIGIYPDELGTIWSGSAAVNRREDGSEELVACFTQGDTERGQIQSLAFSHDDGKTWQMYEGNPVLPNDRPDFRDPKIFRYDDRWIMVVSGGHEAQFYASNNLTDWTLLSTFPAPQPNWIWECPDLLQVDGQWILIVSFIVPGATVDDSSCTRYWIGQFDGTRFTPDTGPHRLSFGPDDYAAVSWSDAPDRRKVISGWMSHWLYAHATPTDGENWRGAMTLPRELSIRNGALIQQPPHELLQRRGAPIAFDGNGVAFESEVYESEAYELEAEIDLTNLQQPAVGFNLRIGPDEVTRVMYDAAKGELAVDREQSGQVDFWPDFARTFRAPLQVADGVLKLRIFVDRCSIEVFAQDGEVYGAALIFPRANSQGIEFTGKDTQLRKAVLYPYS